MKALLHSMEDDKHSHTQEKVDVRIIEWKNGQLENIIVEKQDGTRCRAVFNPFVNTLFVDDLYGVIRETL